MRGFFPAFAVLVSLFPSGAFAQDATITSVAKAALEAAQPDSIRRNREYCGMIGRDGAGQIIVTKARRGSRARCRYPDLPRGVRPVATFHTHGAFLPRFDNEVPSVLDLLSEIRSGTDGYVSTPGGRLWFMDGARQEVRMLCDIGCLPYDPSFVRNAMGPIAKRYTLDDLKRRHY